MNDMPERLPSRPLRNWFLAWHIHTGDPVDVIAKGFDLDPVLVDDLLSGEVSLMLRREEAVHICRRIRTSPESFWRLPVSEDDAAFTTSSPWFDFPKAVALCLDVDAVEQEPGVDVG